MDLQNTVNWNDFSVPVLEASPDDYIYIKTNKQTKKFYHNMSLKDEKRVYMDIYVRSPTAWSFVS